ncbi:MAG: Hpt domain-containing protein [Cyanobacteria bacterium P01_H01_bin.58]
MSDSSNILTSTVQEPSNTAPILNAETLASIRTMAGANAAEFLADIVTDFVMDAPKDIATILQAIANGDAKSLSHSAHRLRSGSASLGADRLAELCQTLEMQGRAGSVPPLADCQGHIQNTYEAAKRALLSVTAVEES